MAEELKRWHEMGGEPAAIDACGDRWQILAEKIGCTVRGFNDDYSASFYTPDGTSIDIGPKFRAVLAGLCTRTGAPS